MLGANMLSMSALSLYRSAVQFALSIAITAFIGPAEYGLVTFTLPFVTLVAMLTDLGLASAITRAPTISHKEAGAAFTLMIAVGGGLALLLAASAFPLAHAVAMPGLGSIVIGMAVVTILTVTATTPRAMLERSLRYGRIATIEAVAVLIAALAGLGSAALGAGAWALVIYNLVNHSLRAAAFLVLEHGQMHLNLGWRRLRGLMSFGGWILATNLLNFLARNGDNLLIGAWLGAAAVGIYGLAYQFMLAPLMAITWPASAILVATLAGQSLGRDAARQMIEGVIAATAAITFPVMAFVSFGLAFPMEALLSPRWHAVPQILLWLAPLGALQSIASYNGAILLVAGKARIQFASTIVNTIALVGTFLIALPHGLLVMVKAYAVTSTLLSFGYLALLVVLTSLSWRNLAHALAPATIGTTAGLVAVAALGGFTPANWHEWLMSGLIYAAAVLGSYALFQAPLRFHLSILAGKAA